MEKIGGFVGYASLDMFGYNLIILLVDGAMSMICDNKLYLLYLSFKAAYLH